MPDVLTITVGLLVIAPDFRRLPPGGPAVAYIGLVLAWGFVVVGAYAWLRRPDNRTGLLMTLVGTGVALSGLQLFDSDLLWALGAMTDAVAVSLLLHLLLAFPSGRLRGPRRAARHGARLRLGRGAAAAGAVLAVRRRVPGNREPAADRRRCRRSPACSR